MKKFITLAMCFALACPFVMADDDDDDAPLAIIPSDNLSQNRFRPEVHAVFDRGLNDDANGGGGVEFVGGLQLDDHWKIGPGAGILGHNYHNRDWSSAEFPVFIQARYDFQAKSISPYFVMQFGENFGRIETDQYDNEGYSLYNEMGFFGKVGFGINVKMKRGRFFFDLGYKIQQVKSNDYRTDMSTPQYCTISMGYVWVPRR